VAFVSKSSKEVEVSNFLRFFSFAPFPIFFRHLFKNCAPWSGLSYRPENGRRERRQGWYKKVNSLDI